jgi:hypothetical protein
MRCRRWVGWLIVVWALTVPLGAEWVGLQTRQVPIERLARNLERQRKAEPKNPEHVINLARLYSMAYAQKSREIPTISFGKEPERPYYGMGAEVRVPYQVQKAPTPAAETAARQFLEKSIDYYELALRLDPRNLAARLGIAWTLNEAGLKTAAISNYRVLVSDAWAIEGKATSGGFPNSFFTEEAVRYFIPLLDPTLDKEEIDELLARRDRLKELPRAITPIAIPLSDDVPLSAIVDPLARVRFDADGSSVPREWTWITPEAGWLVYDATGGGSITSALQLFGSVSYWLFWSNGYHALAALDDDGDGELRGPELAHMALWIDRNRNGVSDDGEVRPLAADGIVALSCRYVEGDGRRVAASSPTGVTLANGRTRPTYDIILRHSAAQTTWNKDTRRGYAARDASRGFPAAPVEPIRSAIRSAR